MKSNYSNLNNTYLTQTPTPRTIPTGLFLGWCQGMDNNNQKEMRPGLDTCYATCRSQNCNYDPSDNNLTPIFWKSADILGTCLNNEAIPYCAIPISADAFGGKEQTNLPNGQWGCQSTELGNKTVWSSDNDEDRVKSYCYYNDNCVGYYINPEYTWFIATDTDPQTCTEMDPNKIGYPTFVKKLKNWPY